MRNFKNAFRVVLIRVQKVVVEYAAAASFALRN